LRIVIARTIARSRTAGLSIDNGAQGAISSAVAAGLAEAVADGRRGLTVATVVAYPTISWKNEIEGGREGGGREEEGGREGGEGRGKREEEEAQGAISSAVAVAARTGNPNLEGI
jgi:hypothetical protein